MLFATSPFQKKLYIRIFNMQFRVIIFNCDTNEKLKRKTRK